MIENFEEKNGLVVGCKFIHVEVLGIIFFCSLKKSPVASCEDCTVCPKCGGRLSPRVDYVPDESPPCLWSRKVCLYCNHQKRGQVIPYSEEAPKEEPAIKHKCSVETCDRRAYENHKVTVEKDWSVCSFHKDRMYNFTHRNMDERRIPFIVVERKLYDNPRYLDYSLCGKKGGK